MGVIDGFDGECAALSGPAGGQPIEWKVNVGNSFALHINNLPGIAVDNVGCITNNWLNDNQERFECILEKATAAHQTEIGTNDTSGLQTAIAKLGEALSQNKTAGCIPTVCAIVSFVVFPVP